MNLEIGGSIQCPLCSGLSISNYCTDKRRSYLCCSDCSLVFVPSDQHLSPEDEKAVYDQHQNSPDDQSYRKFLSRLAEPLVERLEAQSYGLDFGCGPGPTLSLMLEEQGHQLALFDIYYADNPLLLQGSYDFITGTEVVEHLSSPRQELDRLWAMIRPGGYLGLMTKLVKDQQSFMGWHYKNDPTHISFFSVATFNYLADTWGAQVDYSANDVIIFRKSALEHG